MDCNKLKAEYIAGGTSYRKLADKYGVSFNTLKTIAIKGKWSELKQQADNKATTKIVNAIANDTTKKSIKINEVADKLLDKIGDILNSDKEIGSMAIKNLTSSLKDIKDIKGIKSELDMKEQEARIDKLRKDIDGNGDEEGKVYGVIMMPPIMDAITPPDEEDEDVG